MSETVSSSDYKAAKAFSTVCLIVLIACVALLVWTCILVITKDLSKFILLSPIINVCIFSVLFLRNHLKVRKYVRKLESDSELSSK